MPADLKVAAARDASPEEWDRIWASCSYATYFQSRAWAEIWAAYSGGRFRPAARTIRFSDGASALLPYSKRRLVRGFPPRWVMSPGGTYGGWLAQDALSGAHRALLTSLILEEAPDLYWRLNPFDPAMDSSPVPSRAEPDETHALDLSPGFDALLAGWTKGHRSAANKAEREGVRIVPACSEEDWKAYYSIYLDSLRRWGSRASSRYDWKVFRLLRERPETDVRLWLAMCDDEVAAGALCLYASEHVVYWHGAAAEKHFKARPVNLLLREIIRRTIADGYRWFDMNPSGGQDGVRAFKKSFGALELSAPVVRRVSAVHEYRSLLTGAAKHAIRWIRR